MKALINRSEFKNKLQIVGFVSLLAVAACQRPDRSTSVVRFQVPQQIQAANGNAEGTTLSSMAVPADSVSAMDVLSDSSYSLWRVIVNVTGGDTTSNTLGIWSIEGGRQLACDSANGICSLTVSQGTGRLIQVVAIYGSAAGSVITPNIFYYGSVTKDIIGENPPAVDVSISKKDEFVTGRISGRYVRGLSWSGSEFFPTGTIEVKYRPESSKPPIPIGEVGEMVAGWFSVFAISSIKLEYHLNPNLSDHVMFGGPVSMRSNTLRSFNPFDVGSTFSSSSVLVDVPPSKWNAGDPLREARESIWGWFGDGSVGANTFLASKVVNRGAPTESLLLNGQESSFMYSIVGSGEPDPLNQILSLTASNISMFGGSSGCGGNSYDSCLPLFKRLIENGNDSSAPFTGVLRYYDPTNEKLFGVSDSSGHLQLTYQLLPDTGGLAETMEVKILTAAAQSDDSIRRSYSPCDIPANYLVDSANVTLASDADTNSQNLTFPSLSYSSFTGNGSSVVGLCFRKAGVPLFQKQNLWYWIGQ